MTCNLDLLHTQHALCLQTESGPLLAHNMACNYCSNDRGAISVDSINCPVFGPTAIFEYVDCGGLL
jgi:hypothetical protein